MPDENRPATKHDLVELGGELRGDMGELRKELRGEMGKLRSELHGDIFQLRAELDQRFAQSETHLIEQMRDMQTEVLRAFHGWARPIESRLKALPVIEERLSLLEDRVSEIERNQRRA